MHTAEAVRMDGDADSWLVRVVSAVAGATWLRYVFKEWRHKRQNDQQHERAMDRTTRSEWREREEQLRAERDAAVAKADEYEQKYQHEKLEKVQQSFEIDKLRADKGAAEARAKRAEEQAKEYRGKLAEQRERDAEIMADVLNRRIDERLRRTGDEETED